MLSCWLWIGRLHALCDLGWIILFGLQAFKSGCVNFLLHLLHVLIFHKSWILITILFKVLVFSDFIMADAYFEFLLALRWIGLSSNEGVLVALWTREWAFVGTELRFVVLHGPWHCRGIAPCSLVLHLTTLTSASWTAGLTIFNKLLLQ